MLRIAIIGNAGGGKSILAGKLGDVQDLPIYQFDDLQWQPGWTRTPEKEIREAYADGWRSLDGSLLAGETGAF